MPAPRLDRTPSNNSRYVSAGVYCFERTFEGQEKKLPARLVVFDCDETLTLSTFLPKDGELRRSVTWSSQWEKYIAEVNFEPPTDDSGSALPGRIKRLDDMMSELRGGGSEPPRTLAVLTRNNSGPISCLNLLRMSGLVRHFSAVWCMARTPGILQGVYRDGMVWRPFAPPFQELPDHKADVLHDVARRPDTWFPQLRTAADDSDIIHMRSVNIAEIVLVDDVRTNFQSNSGEHKKVLRCCKVARYDRHLRDMGFVQDMGGVGANNLDDYQQLVDFVKEPWNYKSEQTAKCTEACLDGLQDRPSATHVVFDFDGTLTLYTFMPGGDDFRRTVGAAPEARKRYVELNFESPYVEGSRVDRLKELLRNLQPERTLVVLTKSEDGAVAVLNLLMLAGLAEFFSAVWAVSAASGLPTGAYKDSKGEWQQFSVPLPEVLEPNYKTIVLRNVVQRPTKWLPGAAGRSLADQDLEIQNIVLVDDSREDFKAICDDDDAPFEVLRFCKVARYCDKYRDQDFLVGMGGIGARNTEDYNVLQSFVARPWLFSVGAPALAASRKWSFNMTASSIREHAASFAGAVPRDFDDSPEVEDPPLVRERVDEDLTKIGRHMRRRETEPASLWHVPGDDDPTLGDEAAAPKTHTLPPEAFNRLGAEGNGGAGGDKRPSQVVLGI